jgi:ADP-ribosylglycohydrolase/catechol 2,3-dioxygenase-like lactoylglutathione lyase family enzyme
MLAAAFGDALGWPQENRGGRVGGRRGVEAKLDFVEWQRREGSRFAGHVDVIAPGAYSDDTQLVLALTRSLLRGELWWEWWTTQELPFWLLYERGGGGATKRAARLWSSGKRPWADKDRDRYFSAGGNGVAMRVLPHALKGAESRDFDPIARDVLADGITTHGHPRALIGALAFAYALWRALRRDEPLAYGALVDDTIEAAGRWSTLMADEGALKEWREAADARRPNGYAELWHETVSEMIALLRICADGMAEGSLSVDRSILEKLGVFDAKVNGSGTISASGAIFLASRYASRPTQGLLAAAFAHRADTDTLAAMTGALLGAVNGPDWLGRSAERVQDYTYIRNLTSELLRGSNDALKPANGPSPAKFGKVLPESSVGDELRLPDGRTGTVKQVVEHDTKTQNSITSWHVETNDAQTLFFKKIRKLPPESRGSAEEERGQLSEQRIIVPAVEVADVERSLSFYRDLIGLTVKKHTPEYVNLGALLLVPARRQISAAVAPAQLKLDDQAFEANPRIMVFLNAGEIETVRRSIADAMLPMTPISERDGRRLFRCLDPDGTVVELREGQSGSSNQRLQPETPAIGDPAAGRSPD